MSDLIGIWCDAFLLGAIQNLPVLFVALLLDRLLVRLAWPGPRRWIWGLVVAELMLPVAIGSPVHVAGVDALAIPIAGATASTWPMWLFGIWAVGSFACWSASVWAARRFSRSVLRESRRLPASVRAFVQTTASRIGLRRTPDVRLSSRANTACVVGVWRPIVVLDESLLRDHQRFEHALLHELGHVLRRDPLRAWLVRSFACNWWFHPTAWFAPRRFALLREVGCDALVASRLEAPNAYCRTLATRAHDLASPQPAFTRLPAEVLQRIAALRTAGQGSRWLRHGTTLAMASLLLLCCVPLREHLPKLPFSVPSLDEPGCLVRRYLVFGQMGDPSVDPATLFSSPTQEDR